MPGRPVAWVPREEALAPVAALGLGPIARTLGQRVLLASRDVLGKLSGVAGADFFLILGPSEVLPWVDGVQYLGRDPSAPRLLLPTTLAPDVAVALFERAVLERARALEPPLVVTRSPARISSAARARPIDPALVSAWLEIAG